MSEHIKKLLFCMLFIASCHTLAETILPPNTIIYPGQSVQSENGKYNLIMQNDGNLVLYRNDGVVRWNAQTSQSGSYAYMQSDGNFVVYNSSNQALWHTITGGNPGAFLAVQNDGNLVVYNSSGGPLWNIGADVASGSDPRYAGDVIGRDLDYPNLGWLGHLGIWDGGRVVEVLNVSGNVIKLNTLSSFKSIAGAAYWGTAAPNIPNYNVYYCFAARCTNFDVQPWGQTEKTTSRMAIAKRAYQSYLIGADYTIGPNYRATWPGDYFYSAQRGLYRCDTFVLDTLMITVNNYNNTYREPIETMWQSRAWDLYQTTRLPRNIFEKLKTFN